MQLPTPESSPLAAPVPLSGPDLLAVHNPPVTYDRTVEVRWFWSGPLPSTVAAWFCQQAVSGFNEQRSDIYRMDGVAGVGIKRRFGKKLELKRRLGNPHSAILGPNAQGWIETWERWSPADDMVQAQPGRSWVAVGKEVTKRRFDQSGAEIELGEANRAMNGVGCDTDLTAIRVQGQLAWSFAFAAFGPSVDHRAMIANAWCSLVANNPWPLPGELCEMNSLGYPQWLAALSF